VSATNPPSGEVLGVCKLAEAAVDADARGIVSGSESLVG
jgi:hypothetical protein